MMAWRAAARTRLESLSPSAIHVLFVGRTGTKDAGTMTITQTALLTLTDQWQEKVKRFSDEAHKINRSIPEEIREMPTTKGEHSENLHGYAAGYAAARQELLRLLEVCAVCVGTGTTAGQNGTTTMRVYCWKCKGTGMENCPTNADGDGRREPAPPRQ